MRGFLLALAVFAILIGVGVVIWIVRVRKIREEKNYERALKMVPLLIHLPPSTDDIQTNGRDERSVNDEAISEAQVMYAIIASTVQKGLKRRVYGQKHMAFEVIVTSEVVRYYAVVPITMIETVKQAIMSAYPTARIEEAETENIFPEENGIEGVSGGELALKKPYYYPISTYEELKWDATAALLNAFSKIREGEGMSLQILLRPAGEEWIKKSKDEVQKIKDGKSKNNGTGVKILDNSLDWAKDAMMALWQAPEARKQEEGGESISDLDRELIKLIEEKTKYPAFEVLIRVIASAKDKARSDALVGGVVAAFSQFGTGLGNGFKYEMANSAEKLAKDYILRMFPQGRNKDVLNSTEIASVFHLPAQHVIPTSQVERQLTKQVDGPAKLVTDGVLLGVNEFRGVKKEIRLSVEDRRRHTYVIGSTGMGKSVFMRNIAYQDMLEGRGFAFIDPHGDVVEELLSMVPPERVDDVIYFDPGDVEHPIGMNMFEYDTEDQKDFIVQEGINMLVSLYDPGNNGFFGARGQHMFRNAALLLMADPAGATFIDVPKCFVDPEFVKQKLQYVTDRSVYDYWTKEFPASQKSSEAGEITTWFASKWGPFLSNTMMKNILGQTKSGFNLRKIMDEKKILLVNLSKGKVGEVNSKLLGMIFVMKFQAAAMSRVDTPEDERNDFCLFVDEFQNFSTESFESILSEARKFRLNLVVANQFMTQLTEKIREGVLGNVGTIISGRLGVTDAGIMEKVFAPVFNAEDLHKTPNRQAVATVMMFGMPSAPFTMTWPKLGKENWELMKQMKEYSASRHARTRAEVEKEINTRLGAMETSKEVLDGGNSVDTVKNATNDAPKAATALASSGSGVDGAPEDTNASAGSDAASQASVKKAGDDFLENWLKEHSSKDNTSVNTDEDADGKNNNNSSSDNTGGGEQANKLNIKSDTKPTVKPVKTGAISDVKSGINATTSAKTANGNGASKVGMDDVKNTKTDAGSTLTSSKPPLQKVHRDKKKETAAADASEMVFKVR